MEDYLRTLRTRDGTAATSLLMDRDSERELLNQLIQQSLAETKVGII